MRIKIIEDSLRPLPSYLTERIKEPLGHGVNFLPPWVMELCISYNEEEEGMASAFDQAEYLTHSISFGPPSMTCSDGELKNLIYHEIAHAYTSPIWRAGMEIIEMCECDQKVKGMADKVIREKMEQSTEALARFFGTIKN